MIHLCPYLLVRSVVASFPRPPSAAPDRLALASLPDTPRSQHERVTDFHSGKGGVVQEEGCYHALRIGGLFPTIDAFAVLSGLWM